MSRRTTLRTLGDGWRARLAVLALVAACWPGGVPAHEADAWGGLFRTLDAGATWIPINPGIFVSGARALAVSPRDANHLLMTTDTGVWRSRNGGRDWDLEAPDVLTGPAFAATFDGEGDRALVAGSSTLFRHDGDRWRPLRTPAGAAPARALVPGAAPGRVYLAGRSGLYVSDDWGGSWVGAGSAFQTEHVTALLVVPGRPDEVYAVVGGSLWSSSDGARSWQPRREGLSGGGVEAVGFDPSNPARVWVVGAGQVFLGDRRGERWLAIGKPVPGGPATARGVAVSGDVIVIATDRGVLRSLDGGERWEPATESLPGHLAAGVLVRDPRRADTLYAGFALTTYEELQQRAPQDQTAAARTGAVGIATGFAGIAGGGVASVAAGLALLALLASGVIAIVRRTRSPTVSRPERTDKRPQESSITPIPP